jgi:hypothetical protein
MQTTTRDTLATVRTFCREHYAWPGGYPLALMMTDGATLCPACTRANYPLISRATRDNLRDGWQAAAVFIHYEGAPLVCDQCNQETPSAYGDPDAEE